MHGLYGEGLPVACTGWRLEAQNNREVLAGVKESVRIFQDMVPLYFSVCARGCGGRSKILPFQDSWLCLCRQGSAAPTWNQDPPLFIDDSLMQQVKLCCQTETLTLRDPVSCFSCKLNISIYKYTYNILAELNPRTLLFQSVAFSGSKRSDTASSCKNDVHATHRSTMYTAGGMGCSTSRCQVVLYDQINRAT